MPQPDELEASIEVLEAVNNRLAAAEVSASETLAEILAGRSRAIARIEQCLTVREVTCEDALPRLRRVYEGGAHALARLRELRHDLDRQWTDVARANHALHRMLEDGRRNPQHPVAVDVRA